ncbi:MAG: gliding motility-associated C-terminal domain-containing protein, partial [Winogradskyella sp.]
EASAGTTATASAISPSINLTTATDGAELSFYMHAFGEDMGTLNIGVSTSPTGPFTNVYSWIGEYQTTGADAWVPIGVNLDAYLGQLIYVEFSYAGTGGFEGDMSIDFMRVEACGDFCANPEASYAVVDDCDNGDQFLIDVNVTDMGDATSLTLSNNINGTTVTANATGVYQVGPFPFLVDVIITTTNDQDNACSINSEAIQLLACPPDNDNCVGATTAVVNNDDTCTQLTPGTILAATPSGVSNGSCAGDPNDDVWYEFTALNDVQVISLVNITGGTTNLDHALYEGSCGALTELSCTNGTSSITPSLVVGNTYYIRIFSGGSDDDESTTFDLCIRKAPSNLICENAENFCSVGGALTSSNIFGIPSSGDVACLGSIPNPTWNIIQIGTGGLIEIEINQESDNGIGLDVDFALWGPFTSVDQACTDIVMADCPTCPFSNNPDTGFYPFGNIVDCSYSGSATENLTIDNAVSGEIYMLLVTNFSNQSGSISIEQTNAGGSGDGTIEAEISVELTSIEAVVENTPEVRLGFNVDKIEVCGFPSVTIEANSPFADSYVWYKGDIEIIGETTSTLVVTESNNYQVIASDEQCGDDATSQYLDVFLYKESPTVVAQNITLCDGPVSDGTEDFDLDALTATLGLGTDFTVSYYTSTNDANQAINAVSSPYASTGETLIIRIEDTNASNNNYLGCRQLSEVVLVVNDRPVINQPADLVVCDDADGNVDGVTDFDLTSVDADISTDPNIVITYYTTQANADNSANALTSPYTSNGETIYARAEDATTGCYETTSFNLEVNIVPLATFDPQYDYEVCPNATIPVEIGIIPTNFTASQVTIQWYLDGNMLTGENGLILSSVLLEGDYSAEITFNDSGCTNNNIVTNVVELESCIFPEGISPGVSPGQNDTFDLSSHGVVRLEIFNRNGTLVYSKDNYRNEWFGQTNDGEELPVGTYFYTMIYEGGAKKRSAWIYINR